MCSHIPFSPVAILREDGKKRGRKRREGRNKGGKLRRREVYSLRRSSVGGKEGSI